MTSGETPVSLSFSLLINNFNDSSQSTKAPVRLHHHLDQHRLIRYRSHQFVSIAGEVIKPRVCESELISVFFLSSHQTVRIIFKHTVNSHVLFVRNTLILLIKYLNSFNTQTQIHTSLCSRLTLPQEPSCYIKVRNFCLHVRSVCISVCVYWLTGTFLILYLCGIFDITCNK